MVARHAPLVLSANGHRANCCLPSHVAEQARRICAYIIQSVYSYARTYVRMLSKLWPSLCTAHTYSSSGALSSITHLPRLRLRRHPVTYSVINFSGQRHIGRLRTEGLFFGSLDNTGQLLSVLTETDVGVGRMAPAVTNCFELICELAPTLKRL